MGASGRVLRCIGCLFERIIMFMHAFGKGSSSLNFGFLGLLLLKW